MNRFLTILLLIVITATHGLSQTTPADAETIARLKEQISAMSSQIRTMERTIDDLQSRLPPSMVAPAVPSAAPKDTPSKSDKTAISSTSGAAAKKVAHYETAREDQAPAPRPDNAPLDPAFKGYFPLPETGTWMKIGGYIKTDFIYDLRPAGNPDAFIPSTFPVGPVIDASNVNFHARQTRLNFDFRTPIGEHTARTFLEFDFFGSSGPTTPRLRHLYTQYRNILAGLTFSNFIDPDANPDTLDHQGPAGRADLKNPQIRYTIVLPRGSTLSFSAEKPTSDILSRRGDLTAEPNSPAPDLSARWRYDSERGHIQVSSLFRWIAAYTDQGSTPRVFGWGVNVATGFQTFGRDNVVFQGAFGHGISRYLADTVGEGLDAALNSVKNPEPKALPTLGISVGYQHYWWRQLRSNLVYGYAGVENTQLQAGDVFHQSHYGAANIIWRLGTRVDIGAETLYGLLELKNGARGHSTRFQLSTKYRFLEHSE